MNSVKKLVTFFVVFYGCTIFSHAAGAICQRANEADSTAPIRLKSFSALASGCNALLQWTATDAAGNTYTIESSSNGTNFTPIKTIMANGLPGENVYAAKLAQAETIKWYRLQMMNKDGSAQYSRMLAVSLHCQQQNDFSIQPNPVSNTMQVICQAEQTAIYTLLVSDATGKMILKKEIWLQTGSNNVPVDVQAITAGLYYVQFRDAEGNSMGAAQKIIKK